MRHLPPRRSAMLIRSSSQQIVRRSQSGARPWNHPHTPRSRHFRACASPERATAAAPTRTTTPTTPNRRPQEYRRRHLRQRPPQRSGSGSGRRRTRCPCVGRARACVAAQQMCCFGCAWHGLHHLCASDADERPAPVWLARGIERGPSPGRSYSNARSAGGDLQRPIRRLARKFHSRQQSCAADTRRKRPLLYEAVLVLFCKSHELGFTTSLFTPKPAQTLTTLRR
mmetsp:Transcript_6075/g.12930  ORF Transcript_6075/g.12930 Transcript_6075/m.12930 type:complete len:226 (+) Transcript_6075:1040-1717(+)